MKLFNTFSGQLEEFKPLSGKEVRMYACGPTVYDFAHIGNFRTFVFEDLLRRFLEYKGFKVKHVMNVTDVDDKTIAGAAHEGIKLEQFTKKYLDAFNEDLKTLNILPPTKQPRATAEIPEMVKLIAALIEKKAAYVSDGSVYYRVESFKNYGKLSKKDLKQNIKSARVDADEYDKEEGSDFALWKKAKEGEPFWDSPWGKGRPGWHIECSAMSMKYLGESFDIHAGGEDLIFPHHENEIAQSEGTTGKPFVKYWLHAKHLLVNGEKMSKSKGNFYTLRDLLAKGYDPMAIRYCLLHINYKSQMNFTFPALKAANSNVKHLRAYYSSVKDHIKLGRKFSVENKLASEIKQAQGGIIEALDDDLNISKAIAVFSNFTSDWDSKIKGGAISEKDWKELIKFISNFVGSVLGIIIDEPVPDEIHQEIKKREVLRKEKKFNEADQIRTEVERQGYITWDEASGSTGIAKI